MSNIKGSLVQQTADQVLHAVQRIARCDFQTGIFAYTTTTGEVTWIGFADHGPKRRYFTVSDAHSEDPKVNLITKSESTRNIEDVDLHENIELTLSLDELVSGGFTSVHRLLGLAHMITIVPAEDKRLRAVI